MAPKRAEPPQHAANSPRDFAFMSEDTMTPLLLSASTRLVRFASSSLAARRLAGLRRGLALRRAASPMP